MTRTPHERCRIRPIFPNTRASLLSVKFEALVKHGDKFFMKAGGRNNLIPPPDDQNRFGIAQDQRYREQIVVQLLVAPDTVQTQLPDQPIDGRRRLGQSVGTFQRSEQSRFPAMILNGFNNKRHHRWNIAVGVHEVADRLDADFGVGVQNYLFDLLLVQPHACGLSLRISRSWFFSIAWWKVY
ncbi:hypothetical protein CA54_60910 [Symmachiella macrocystis]|uniref:Uncharacterized protein n=1 Tax=Symmachiella macrocystis TaxID=2527985 RepID=A0A5C6AYH3_9PLAN|nr:hypothetical protein CA54_60910 [Symmachiella macrocystis]